MKIPQCIAAPCRRALLISLSMLLPFSVAADETEIFYQGGGEGNSNANVLFLLDGSGSMDDLLPDGGSRMQVMKQAFREVLAEIPDNINVGLMDYANVPTRAGYGWSSIKGVAFPVSPADQDAAEVIGAFSATDNISVSTLGADGAELPVKAFLANVVDTWEPSGYTPIVDSLYEAARYFKGEEVVWGKFPPGYKWAAHPSTYTGSVGCDSPTQESCTLEWGECNGTESSCTDTMLTNICCETVTNPVGNKICKNNNYSCTEAVTSCQHEVCGNITSDAEYISPIKQACQSNYLVLMSDGKPEYSYYPTKTTDGTGRYPKSAYPDRTYGNNIPNTLPAITAAHINPAIPALIGGAGTCADSPNGYKSGTCGPELTHFLATSDLNSALEGEQTVQTYTVAFALEGQPNAVAYLESLATAADGAFTADNASELVDAFKLVFGDIEKNSFSFSSPSFSVSEDSLLSHGSTVYVPVLSSNTTPLWSGNLRKFKLDETGSIVGKNNANALTDAGNFTELAQDLWSDAVHGEEVKDGGAAHKIPDPEDRVLRTDRASDTLVNLHTDTPNTEDGLPNALFSMTYRTEHDLQDWLGGGADGESLLGWYIDCDGNKKTVTPFGSSGTIKGPVNIEAVTTCGEVITDAERDQRINFTRGYVDGVAGEGAVARQHMGDMLNTKPVVVSYKTTQGTKTVVLAATNEGFLHAINADTGVEEWAFMPASLLDNQVVFMEDKEAERHVYGLDGAMTLWTFTDDDGNDKKYLYFGMRRGGKMYYALDISSPTEVPKVLWKISPEGGAGTAGNAGDYASLGETWSKPTLSRIRDPESPTGDKKYVLVFGGGYDPRKEELDPALRAATAELGSDVYIVDALNGDKIWSLKSSGATGVPSSISANSLMHSIPGDIRVLDMDNDGSLDRMYFADTGGYVWRVDIRAAASSTGGGVTLSLGTTLTKFADLGAGTEDGDRRKFFYEPDTALRLWNGEPKLIVSIGSGYRTHPLDTGDNDRFYVLLDDNVYGIPENETGGVYYSAITNAGSDLMSVTELRASATGNILSEGKRGWYYPLGFNGEKVLATSLTFLDKVLFTTFALADENGIDSAGGVCEPVTSTARAYVLDLLTGKAVANLNRSTDDAEGADPNDDFLIAGYNEILDSPQLIFSALTSSSGGACEKGDCHQSVSVRIGKLDMPLLDMMNASGSSAGNVSSSVDLTQILPRLYWRDNGVSGSEKLVGDDSSPPSPE